MNFSSDDPKIFGPEKWEVGQSLAIKAKTKEKATNFVNIVWRDIVEDIRCTHCRTDALNYLNTHPFVYRDELSAFRYIYDMHEFVNAKLGKKGISFASAVERYTSRDPTHCSTACANTADTPSTTSKNSSYPPNPSIVRVNLPKPTPSKPSSGKISITAASGFSTNSGVTNIGGPPSGVARITFSRH